MIGAIAKVSRSKSGKTLSILIGEQWYTSKNWELEQEIGRSLIFDPSMSEYNGQVIHWLNDYVFEDSSNTPATAAFNQAHGGSVGDIKAAPYPYHDEEQRGPPAGHPAAPDTNSPPAIPVTATTVRPTIDPMQFMPFTSNQVAHAIAAGLITTPEQMEKWANAAFSAAKSCVEIPY